MLKRFIGIGCVALVAFAAAACSSTVEADDADEAVGSTSQAVGECNYSVKAFAGNFTTNCSTVVATKAITQWDVKLMHRRAQAYFAYMMGGPVPTGMANVAGIQASINDSYWSNSSRGTGPRLCAIRNAIKANRAVDGVQVENDGFALQLCALDAVAFRFRGRVLPVDGTGCGYTPPAGGVGVGTLLATLGRNQQADRGWCVQDGIDGVQGGQNLPSFLNVSYIDQETALVDPEPVTLRSGLSASVTTASADGVESGLTYTAYRFSSGLCGSALNTLMNSAMYGVPCVTTSAAADAVVSKYIKRTGSGSTAYCMCL